VKASLGLDYAAVATLNDSLLLHRGAGGAPGGRYYTSIKRAESRSRNSIA